MLLGILESLVYLVALDLEGIREIAAREGLREVLESLDQLAQLDLPDLQEVMGKMEHQGRLAQMVTMEDKEMMYVL